jgi:hypothetical protein
MITQPVMTKFSNVSKDNIKQLFPPGAGLAARACAGDPCLPVLRKTSWNDSALHHNGKREKISLQIRKVSGWSGLQKNKVPDSIVMIDSIPQSWLFPRVSAVVHQGGASTAAAGLRAGIQSVVIPFFGDQPFWGQRIADLGVGAEPISCKKLTAEGLAIAIQGVLTNEGMRQRSASLGENFKVKTE